MEKEYFVSEETWNYRFWWIEKDSYIEGKKKCLDQYFDNEKTDNEKVVDRLYLSVRYLFDSCVKVIEKNFDCVIRLVKVCNDNVRVPLETVYNDEVFEESLKAGSEEWRYLVVNMNSLENIAERLLKKKCTGVKREKYIEDWCQYLEGVMVQELAHILFLEDVVRDNKRKILFVKQMKDYPKMNDSLSIVDRQAKYLTVDIEKHGRMVEVDFLSRIYPNSWAEAWVKKDLGS